MIMQKKIALEEHFSIEGMDYKNDVMGLFGSPGAWVHQCVRR